MSGGPRTYVDEHLCLFATMAQLFPDHQQPNGQIDHSVQQQQDGQVNHSSPERRERRRSDPEAKGEEEARAGGQEVFPARPGAPTGAARGGPARAPDLINLLGVDRNPICTLRRLLNRTDATPGPARLQIAYDDACGLLECADGEKALMADSNLKLQMAAHDRRGNRYVPHEVRQRWLALKWAGAFVPFLRENGLQKGHTLVM